MLVGQANVNVNLFGRNHRSKRLGKKAGLGVDMRRAGFDAAAGVEFFDHILPLFNGFGHRFRLHHNNRFFHDFWSGHVNNPSAATTVTTAVSTTTLDHDLLCNGLVHRQRFARWTAIANEALIGWRAEGRGFKRCEVQIEGWTPAG